MYDVLVLAAGGGWRTDLTTGSLRRALDRYHWLRNPARVHRAVVRVVEQGTGRRIRVH